MDLKELKWTYDKPQKIKPKDIDTSKLAFYHNEEDWKATVQARLCDSSVLSKSVSLCFNSDEFINIESMVNVCQLGNISAGFEKMSSYEIHMRYQVEFYSQEDYYECNKNVVKMWSTNVVQKFLEFLDLREYCIKFAANAISGNDLVSHEVDRLLEMMQVNKVHARKILDAVQAYIQGNSNFQ